MGSSRPRQFVSKSTAVFPLLYDIHLSDRNFVFLEAMNNPRSPTALGLCDSCSLISLPSLCQSSGHTHLADATSLIATSYTCDLCNLIRRALDQNNSTIKTDGQFRKFLAPRPVVLYGIQAVESEDADGDAKFKEDGPAEENTICGPLMLIGIEVWVPVIFDDDSFDIVRLSLFAEPGSEVQMSRDVIGTRLLHDPGCSESMELLRSWYTTCISEHPACDEVGSFLGSQGLNTAPPLPTRVLYLSDPTLGSEEVRLFESNGARAPYVALSHCWGKNRILTTTTVNIAKHLQTISMSDLSKTFQDAVFISRQMGIAYLWIDSLCIVQDDPDDWRRESVLMGAVYKNAALTIAASGAEDGRQGCFLPRPSRLEPVRLPYLTKRGDEEAVFVDLFSNEEDGGLDLCPLGQRGWITQEWILSPRLVHYTKARMIWSCRALLKSEDQEPMAETDEQRLLESARRYRDSKVRGEGSSESLLEDMEDFFANWCSLVTTYSSRSLTYEKDKPIAIFGLGEEISAAVGELYTGGFIHQRLGDSATNTETLSIILQLFWFAKDTMSRPEDLQDSAPSWSWASTIGSVAHHVPARTAKPLVQKLGINRDDEQQDRPATISLTGRIGGWSPGEYRRGTVDKELRNLIFTGPGVKQSIEYTIPYARFFSRSTNITGASLLSQKAVVFLGQDGQPFGWASFDSGVIPSEDEEDVHIAVFSENEMDRVFDGFNVMFLRSIPSPRSEIDGLGRRQFARLGVGEILDLNVLNDTELQDVVLR